MAKKRGELKYIVDDASAVKRVPADKGGYSFYMTNANQGEGEIIGDTGLVEITETTTGKINYAVHAPYKPLPRKPTRSYENEDRSLVEKMNRLIESGECPSRSAAALRFVDEAVGNGNTISKQRRLVRAYDKVFGKK